MGTRRHGQEGALAPPPLWKCFNLFLCSNSYSKTFGRITYTLFSQPVVGLATGTSPSNPIGDPSMDHAWGLSSPAQSPNLPTPGKILWAPMHQTHFHNKMNCNSFSSKFSSLLQKFYQSRPFWFLLFLSTWMVMFYTHKLLYETECSVENMLIPGIVEITSYFS